MNFRSKNMLLVEHRKRNKGDEPPVSFLQVFTVKSGTGPLVRLHKVTGICAVMRAL